jgi:hypothetical protein
MTKREEGASREAIGGKFISVNLSAAADIRGFDFL